MSRLSILSEAVFENKENLFFNGIEANGKSYLLKQLYDEASKRGINSVLTSNTGVILFNI